MIVTPKEIDLLKIDGLTVGVTSGCFDLLHFYHLHYLQRCREHCDFLIVGVDSDDLVNHFKNKVPVIPEYQRVAMVASLRCVDAAFVMRGLDDFHAVSKHAYKVFKNHPTLYGKPIVGDNDDKLFVIPDVAELTSTTAIMKHIKKGKHR